MSPDSLPGRLEVPVAEASCGVDPGRAVVVSIIATGPVAAVVGLLIKNPQGLDGVGWLILAGYGVLAWFFRDVVSGVNTHSPG
jgi:hypothetical protein